MDETIQFALVPANANLRQELLLALLLAVGLALLLTPLCIRVVRYIRIFDYPDERKIHKRPVALLGGLAVYLAFFLTVAFFFFWNPSLATELTWERFLGLYLGCSIVLILGVFDDLFGSGAQLKFIVQGIAAAVLFYFGFRIEFITNPLGGVLEFDIFTSFLLTIFWVAAITNAVNLLDGLDGLAAGVAAIAATTLFLVALSRGDLISSYITLALIGALLGFLPYNFFPAKIFLGDTGSLLIGFILAALGMLSFNKALTALALIIPIAALGIPVYDTVMAIIRRSQRGANIFKADKEHIHHTLLQAGLSQRQAMLLLCIISAYFGVLAYLCILVPNEYAVLIFLVFVISVWLAVRLTRQLRINITLRREADRADDDDGEEDLP